MDKRSLYGTDLNVSVDCYGPMRVAQDSNDPNVPMHQRAMRTAIDRGVNFIHSTESAAAAMAHPSEQVLIAYYNPLEMDMTPIINKLVADGGGFLAIRPLYEGVLTKRYASQADLPTGHRLGKEKYADAFRARNRLAAAFPEAADDMTRFAIRFPLLSANCASVIVGLNSEVQVNEICDHVESVLPNAETVAAVRALITE